MLSHIPRARGPVSRAPNREDTATVSKYMAVSTTATQQGLQGKPKEELLWDMASDSEEIKSQVLCHADTHRSAWEGLVCGVPRTYRDLSGST